MVRLKVAEINGSKILLKHFNSTMVRLKELISLIVKKTKKWKGNKKEDERS